MSEHTPGPWNHRSDPYDDGTPYHRITAGKPEIYDAETQTGFQLSAIMSDADAALIVAAPRLLDALRQLVNRAGENDENGHWPCWDDARDAIAKATAPGRAL